MSQNMRRISSVLVFLMLWEAVVRFGLVQKFLVAAPTQVALEIWTMSLEGPLLEHIGASMSRVLMGYTLALVTGVLIGALMGWFRWLDDIVDPLVELFRPVSPLAILPLAILWLGIGQASKIFVIWYGCFFPILLNTYAGVRSVPKSNVEAAQTLGAHAGEMLRHVVFFNSLPMIMTGARISFAVGMIVIIASEMVAADKGLGYLILTAQQTFKTVELYVGITSIALIGFAGDRVLRALRTRLCPWHIEIDKPVSNAATGTGKMRSV
jgi:ABC-type nitrate/sulfonate/bicarbonate transport system permease component